MPRLSRITALAAEAAASTAGAVKARAWEDHHGNPPTLTAQKSPNPAQAEWPNAKLTYSPGATGGSQIAEALDV